MPPRVEIVVQDFVGFIAEYASNISRGGMFIGTDEPHPTGTEIEFDVHLAEDRFSLIHGRGVVAWVRTGDAERPPGMGVRFSSLEGDSLSFIERIVDNYVAEGGAPFELECAAPAAFSASTSAQDVEPPPSDDTPAVPPSVRDQPQSLPSSEDGEPLSAVRSLGHSGRAFAPGMEPADELGSQEERARAPKPSIPGAGSESPEVGAPETRDPRARPTETSAAVKPPAIEVPTLDEPPVVREEEPLFDPELELRVEETPSSPAESSAGTAEAPVEPEASVPSPESTAENGVSLEEPALDLEGEIELSLEMDDDDFSIEFDTTNSLESERESAAVEAAEAEPEDVLHDEPARAPDPSTSLGPGMVAAGIGSHPALTPEDDAGYASDPGDDSPHASEQAWELAVPPADEDATSSVDEPGLDVGDLGDIGDTSALEALVGELRTAGEEPDEAADETSGAAVASPMSDLEQEALASLDAQLASGNEALRAESPPTPEPVESRPVDRAPAKGPPVLSELDSSQAYPLPTVRRRLRGGQLRRWTVLLVLLGVVGGGVFFVRERGVDLLLGPGSAFELSAEPLPESEDLGEIEPSTLLELMQQEQPQVEIEELESGRQRQGRPLSLIENVTWGETDRTTILTLWGNGDFTPSSTTYVRLDGETSREVLQIRGVAEPYWSTRVRIGTGAVDGLRFGYRERKPFNEIHLAIDLAQSSVRVRRIEIDGRRLRVFVR